MRRIHVTFALALLGGFAFSSIASSAEPLRIGSFNIENLGRRAPSHHEPADQSQSPEDLAEYIRNSAVDVLALQEIHDTDENAQTRSNEVLSEVIDLLNEGDGGQWDHQLLPKKSPGSTSQLLAVAWNCGRVELVGAPLTIQVPRMVPHPAASSPNGFNVWDRGLHALKFRPVTGGTDFVLIPVHMKSNVGGQTVNSIQRGIEAEIFIDSLPEISEHFGDLDVFVAGDTNILDDDEAAIENLAAADYRDLNEDQQTFVTGAPFDRFFVPDRPAFADSVLTVSDSGFELGDDKEHERRLSDHLLVFIDVAIADEEDPGEDPNHEPPVAPITAASLNILAVLPDPIGTDARHETITIANGTSEDVSVDGWKCVDRAGHETGLSGSIPSNGTRSFTVGAGFSLNNSGDSVRLVAANGAEVDEVEYEADRVERGRFIVFQP